MNMSDRLILAQWAEVKLADAGAGRQPDEAIHVAVSVGCRLRTKHTDSCSTQLCRHRIREDPAKRSLAMHNKTMCLMS